MSLGGRAGPGPWRWGQLPGWRSRCSRDPLQCPVEGGRVGVRAASLAWIPGIWAALMDGEQLQVVGWGPCLLLGPSHRKDMGGSCPRSCLYPTHLPKCVHMLAARPLLRLLGICFFHPSWGLCLVSLCPDIPWGTCLRKIRALLGAPSFSGDTLEKRSPGP